MPPMCDENTARFMSESLLNHAREIHRYARTYPGVIAALPAGEAAEARDRFVKNVGRMADEMEALMLMARYGGVSRCCNREQVEAHIDGARAAAGLARRAPDIAPAAMG